MKRVQQAAPRSARGRPAGLIATLLLLGAPSLAWATPSTTSSCPAAMPASGFWPRLDALCARAPAEAPDDEMFREVTAYCSTRKEPSFAALAEPRRMEALAAMARSAQVPLDSLGPPTITPAAVDQADDVLGPLLDRLVASKLARTPQLGAAADALARKALAELCTAADVRGWLPATCAPMTEGSSFFVELRKRAISDAVLALARMLRSGADTPGAKREQQLAGAAALRALLGPARPRALAAALMDAPWALPGAEECSGPVAKASGAPLPLDDDEAGAAQADVASLAARIVTRLAQDGPTLDRSDEHYERVVVRILRASHRLRADEALSPARKAAVRSLLEALRKLEPESTPTPAGPRPPPAPADEPPSPEAPGAAPPQAPTGAVVGTTTLTAAGAEAGAARLLTKVTADAIALVADSPVAIPDELYELLAELGDGKIESAVDRAAALGGGDALPAPVRRALVTAVQLAFAADERDVERIAKSTVAPWIGGLIVDANVGAPVLTTTVFNVNFGGTLGYEADRWGARASVDRAVYDTQLDGRDYLDARLNTAVHGWYNFASLRAPLGFGVGAKLGFDQFFSSLTILDATGTVSDEVSTLFRAELNGNVWGSPSERLFFRGQLAGGINAEGYEQEVVVAAGPSAGQTRNQRSTTAGDYRVRALATWRTIPRWVRTTLAGRVGLLQLTQTRALYTYDLGTTFTNQNVTANTTRLDAAMRLIVDAEALEVFDLIRPGIYAEVEYVRKDDGSAVVASIVPSVGVGLRSYVPF